MYRNCIREGLKFTPLPIEAASVSLFGILYCEELLAQTLSGIQGGAIASSDEKKMFQKPLEDNIKRNFKTRKELPWMVIYMPPNKTKVVGINTPDGITYIIRRLLSRDVQIYRFLVRVIIEGFQ